MKMTVVLALVCVTFGLAAAQDSDAAVKRYELDIPQQPLDAALKDLAQQTGLQIARFTDNGHGSSMVGPVRGDVTAETALDSLLASSGLEYSFINDRTVAVASVQKVAEAGGESDSGNGTTAGATPRPMMMTQASQEQSQTSGRTETSNDEDEERRPLEEIIVTGTLIRGIGNIASPTQTFDRAEIDRSGFATTHQFLQAQPINFNGGQSETTVGSITGASKNFGNAGSGTGINLRGLGNESTLVLVNGRRTVGASKGDFVDLSLIPTSAIERIEIVADGSSAIYGSDAVGGVVNIILLDDYNGAETRARHGRATQGGLEEYRVGQSLGTTWADGDAFVSFEWYSRGNLDANDRPFSEDTADPLFLLPSQRRRTLFANVKQALDEKTEISGFATYAARDADNALSSGPPTNVTKQLLFAEVEQFSGSLALEHQFNSSWSAELSGVYGVAETKRTNMQNDALFDDVLQKPKLLTVDLKADGGIFAAPGGIAKLAIGGQYRRDELSFSASRTGISEAFDRNVAAIFGEVYVPLVSEQNRVPGVRELAFSAAGRFEHYSDFGSTTNPKVGARWSPVEGLTFRSTWGKSFRAPLLQELNDSDVNTVGFFTPNLFFSDPASPTGFSGLVWTQGGNRNLVPERATTWSVGFDTNNFLIPNLGINATYFEATYTERISNPFQEISVVDTFLRADELGPLLTRIDDPLVKEDLFSTIDTNVGLSVDDIAAFLDARTQNLSNIEESAFDFHISYVVNSGVGDFTFDVSGTYILELETQLTDTAPLVSKVDTIFNPADLRLRSGASWSGEGITLSGFLNYVDGYTNNLGGIEEPVNSWTTVDLAATLELGERVASARIFHDLILQVSVINLLDQDPPFVDIGNPTFPVQFDGANANANGRVVAVELIKRW